MKLKKYKLYEIADLNKCSIRNSDNTPSEFIYLDTSSITENVILGTCKVSIHDAPSRAQRRVKKNTILYSTVRPRLKHYGILPSPESNLIVSTGFVTIDVKSEFQNFVDARFLFLLLTQPHITEHIASIADSAVSAYPSFNPSDISALEFEIPEMNIQTHIADIWGYYDSKIALNRQINDNLEAQLRLITSRYIFSCPNLEKKRIGEIATVKAGGDCPITFSKTRTQKCNIPIFSNGTEDRGLYGFTNKANIEGHSITVAARGTIGYCERRLMPFVPIIRLLTITPREDGAYIYLHQVIRGMKFKKNGSVQQQLTVPEISFIEIPYPHSSVLREYNKVASPIVEMIERNISENEILTKQRDELLPLLMNGQATVNYHLSSFPHRSIGHSFAPKSTRL